MREAVSLAAAVRKGLFLPQKTDQTKQKKKTKPNLNAGTEGNGKTFSLNCDYIFFCCDLCPSLLQISFSPQKSQKFLTRKKHLSHPKLSSENFAFQPEWIKNSKVASFSYTSSWAQHGSPSQELPPAELSLGNSQCFGLEWDCFTHFTTTSSPL